MKFFKLQFFIQVMDLQGDAITHQNQKNFAGTIILWLDPSKIDKPQQVSF